MTIKFRNEKFVIWVLLLLIFSGCATYYAKTRKFNENVANGEMDKADKLLLNDKKEETKRNAILHFLNHGYVTFMLKDWQRSNQYFQRADQLIEDQQKNYAADALSYFTNPMVKPYKPEDFEAVMLNYFTSLNYINQGDINNALVECRRINIKLNKLNDKYPDHKNRYQRDAFAHLMMGLLYDADKNFNDAFIAYRNAYEIYETDYQQNFGIGAPLQLKKDLLRTAYVTGFYNELAEYETKFKMKYTPGYETSLVFFWLNGFGPVKDEWSLNLSMVKGQGGNVTFVNEELGLSFPFFLGNMGNNEQAALSDLRIVRVAFPKYVERVPYYTSSQLVTSENSYLVEMTENINDIAFKTLKDRMLRELGKSILRLATKQAMEEIARRQNPNAGLIVGIVNAVTEKADTRNWQTLPYSFSYSRIPLNTGENKYKLKANAPNGTSRDYNFTVNAEKGRTYFQSFHTIEMR